MHLPIGLQFPKYLQIFNKIRKSLPKLHIISVKGIQNNLNKIYLMWGKLPLSVIITLSIFSFAEVWSILNTPSILAGRHPDHRFQSLCQVRVELIGCILCTGKYLPPFYFRPYRSHCQREHLKTGRTPMSLCYLFLSTTVSGPFQNVGICLQV